MPGPELRGASLKRRLLALLLVVSATVWLGASAVAYLEARHEAAELLDAHLAQSAALLVAQAGEALEEIDLEHAPVLHRAARKVGFQLWERGTRLRLHSGNAPDERLSSVETGFSDAVHQGTRWRVFGAWDAKHETLVQVGEHAAARDEIAAGLGASLALPLAAALPLLALALWLSVGRALQPLENLRGELAARSPDKLAPLDASRAPAEVRPMLEEINRLFARIGQLIERERRFTADAAHELRTPLAGLATQAQVARSAREEAPREEALDALVAGAGRAARLVEQLLTLARLESGEQRAFTSCDLREVLRAAIADLAPLALAKDIDIALEGGAPLPIQGHAELLGILARNLVDNAVRYTPQGGRIRADVHAESGEVRLALSNTSPALPEEVLARLGERFFRPPGCEASGSGLGLSIVVRIAELHRGVARFAAGPGGSGFRASVELPLNA